MEEIIRDLYHMWGLFWETSTNVDKFLAVSNVIGAVYTFIISFILFHKVDLIQEDLYDVNTNIVKAVMIIIMIGSFIASLAVRVPLIYEFMLSAGLTALLTYLLHLTIKSGKN